MTLDRFFILLCLSFLPILWLPQQALLPMMLFATLLMLYFGFKQRFLPFMLGLIMLLSYGQVLKIANQTENFTAYKNTQPIEIIKILKQRSKNLSELASQNTFAIKCDLPSRTQSSPDFWT